jgi:hypothetical protein
VRQCTLNWAVPVGGSAMAGSGRSLPRFPLCTTRGALTPQTVPRLVLPALLSSARSSPSFFPFPFPLPAGSAFSRPVTSFVFFLSAAQAFRHFPHPARSRTRHRVESVASVEIHSLTRCACYLFLSFARNPAPIHVEKLSPSQSVSHLPWNLFYRKRHAFEFIIELYV